MTCLTLKLSGVAGQVGYAYQAQRHFGLGSRLRVAQPQLVVSEAGPATAVDVRPVIKYFSARLSELAINKILPISTPAITRMPDPPIDLSDVSK